MHRTKKKYFLIFVALIAGCGSTYTGTTVSSTVYSCNVTSGPTACCTEYVGSGYNQSTVQADCAQVEGIFSTTYCATTNRVGSCDFGAGTAIEITQRYYSTNTVTPNSTAAQALCSSTSVNGVTGTFTPN